MEKRIVAIGGGEIGGPGTKVETLEIDKEIIRLSGRKNPKLLFLPTASNDAEGYVDTVRKYFGKRLGCIVDVLYLVNKNPSQKELKEKILAADIIYVGGGNTLKMMMLWRKLGVDRLLIEAYNKGIIMCGLSAGSNCWFRHGNSQALKFKNKNNSTLVKVAGLGLIKALHCPHYDIEKPRQKSVKEMMEKTSGIAITLDNACALEIVNDTYRIISSKKGAKARKAYWKKGKYRLEEIEEKADFLSMRGLLSKK